MGILESALKRSEYAEAEAEYQKLRSAGFTNPDWYSFFGGPRNLEQLAGRVDLPAMYEIAYRAWSGVTHATDVLEGIISSTVKAQTELGPIRTPAEAQFITMSSLNLALGLYKCFVNQFVTDQLSELTRWYDAEIREVYMGLCAEGTPSIELVF